jgi:hypothetical protein
MGGFFGGAEPAPQVAPGPSATEIRLEKEAKEAKEKEEKRKSDAESQRKKNQRGRRSLFASGNTGQGFEDEDDIF